MHIKVVSRNHNAANFLRDLQTALLGVRSAQIRIQAGGKSYRQNRKGRRLASGQESLSGGTCSRATHRGLNEAAIDRRHAREQELRVGLVACTQPLDIVERLSNAGDQAIVINAKAA